MATGPARPPHWGMLRPTRLARVALGLSLLALTLAPAFQLLDHPGTGGYGQGTLAVAASDFATTWLGILLAGGVGLVIWILVPGRRLDGMLRGVSGALTRPSPARWVGFVTISATGLALAVGLLLFQGQPTLGDGMVSLLHARFLAAGRLSGALPGPAAAWMVPNGLLTPEGWVSQYPPTHLLLLALGLKLGAPWLVGPALTGLAVALTALAAHRLLGPSSLEARLGSLLVAVSPFLVVLGGGYLSHVSAATFAALTLWAALKARDGAWGWSVATGVAVGLLVTSRPWTGLALGLAFSVGVWAAAAFGARPPEERAAHLARLVPRLAGATLGGLPIAIAWGAYNLRFFGHPLRLGYTASFGASHGLGFHTDPWGAVYGPLEALGYTSSDLLALGFHLLETPLSVVPAIAAYLILARRLPRGAGPFVAWALLPVAANFLYWHHGAHLGPRMLYEAAPGWIFLAALGAVTLARAAASEAGGRHLSAIRRIALWAVVASVPAALYFAPRRLSSYRWDADTLQRLTVPSPREPGPALVFVHGSWTERIGARLQAAGIGLDSLDTALRRNDTCALHLWASVRLHGTTGGGGAAQTLDFEPVPGRRAELDAVELSPGDRVLVDRSAPWTPECEREARSDRNGVISLTPLLWQGDLPGVEHGAPMYVRDLGPEGNREVMARFPRRTPWLYVSPRPGAPPELIPYAEGEPLVW